MKISIITACLNNVTTIGATLASIDRQSWRDIEHIVVDGGSTDGTLEIVREWDKHPIRLIEGPDDGIYDAMNKGIAIASGDAIGFLNADDRYADGEVLASIIAALSDEAVDFTHSDLVLVNPFDRRVVRYWQGERYDPRRLTLGWLPAHPTLYVRRALFRSVGAFSVAYRAAGDIDWMIRLLQRPGLRSVYIPRVLVEMNAGGISNAGVGAYLRASRDVWRACVQRGLRPAPFVLGKTLRKLPQWLRRRGLA